jgi:hypothetical protein
MVFGDQFLKTVNQLFLSLIGNDMFDLI